MNADVGEPLPEAGGFAVRFADLFQRRADQLDVLGAEFAEAVVVAEAQVGDMGGVYAHDHGADGVGGDGVEAGNDDIGLDR